MEERIKFLDDTSKTEKKDDDKLSRMITEDNYRKYMKKFYGFDHKLLAEMKKAKDEFYNDLIQLTGNDLINDNKLKESSVKIRTESGRVQVKYERSKEFPNPQTGEKFTKPHASIKVKVNSFINKSIIQDLEKQIKIKL